MNICTTVQIGNGAGYFEDTVEVRVGDAGAVNSNRRAGTGVGRIGSVVQTGKWDEFGMSWRSDGERPRATFRLVEWEALPVQKEPGEDRAVFG